MIAITYEYDNADILVYRVSKEQVKNGYSGLLPRQDEFVEIERTTYRIETIKHSFNTDNLVEIEQYITIKLTRQLAIRSI